MRLISWNVNGLRAILAKGFEEIVKDLDADIFLLTRNKNARRTSNSECTWLFPVFS